METVGGSTPIQPTDSNGFSEGVDKTRQLLLPETLSTTGKAPIAPRYDQPRVLPQELFIKMQAVFLAGIHL